MLFETLGDRLAGVIIEPMVQGAGGMQMTSPETLTTLIELTHKYGGLVIADEVMTGFGRTGNWFASQTMDLKPDLITLAKGLTSGYMPMSAVMVSDKIANYLIDEGGEFFHGFTYSGHPVSAAVALANIKLIEEEGLIRHVRDILSLIHI